MAFPFEVQKSQILSATLYAASIMTTGEELFPFITRDKYQN